MIVIITITYLLERKIEIITINSVDQIPSLEEIRKIPRSKKLKIVFEESIQRHRESIGQNLKKELDGFLVGIHTFNPEINISKLITEKEIEDNQIFFEDCAKDYRELAEILIFKLAKKHKTSINLDFPLFMTFNNFKGDKRRKGKMDEWKYFIHGFHCAFENTITGQNIEVPLVFGTEFGDLDPYFFSNYIKTTPSYKPLLVEIFDEYHDGYRINEKMLALGKFERINSNIENHYGIAVTDRIKVQIKVFNPEQHSVKSKFNFWKFIGLK